MIALPLSAEVDVRISERGPGRVDLEVLEPLIGRFEADPPSEAELEGLRNRLLATGWFDAVEVRAVRDASGGRILMGLQTRPVLGEVLWEGLVEVSGSRALRLTRLTPGERFSPEKGQAAADRLRKALAGRGYPQAQVSWRGVPSDLPGVMNLRFEVQAGPKALLEQVIFEGNTVFTDAELLDRVLQKPPSGRVGRALGQNRLDLENLPDDAAAIRLGYLARGYFDVILGEPELRIADGTAELHWHILNEGPQYRIGEIRLQGDVTLEPALLHQWLELKSGDPANVHGFQEIPDKVREGYLLLGQPYVEVSHEVSWRDEAALIDLEIMVEAQPRPVVRSVRVEGNTRNREAVILREIPLRPGEAFDVYALRLGMAKLMSRNWFESVSVRYGHEGDPSVSDVIFDVEEKQTGQIQGGLSYADVEGPSFLLEGIERNFRMGHPFRGGGDRLTAFGQVGPNIQRLKLRLDKLYFPTTAFDTGFDVGYENNEFISDFYTQRKMTFGVDFLHVVNAVHSVSFGPRWTFFEIQDVDAALEVDPAEADVRLSAVEFTWGMDTTNQRFRPLQGIRMRHTLILGTDVLGGDTELIGLNSRAAWYMSPFADHVFSVRAGFESMDPIGSTERLPLPLRVALGGQDTLRGFAYRSISPRDEQGIVVGGLSMGWVTAEYLWPVSGISFLDLAFYVDAGDVSVDAWSFSGDGPYSNVGIGFLFRAENFPVRFDAAVPLNVPEGDPENETGEVRLSFSVGYRF